MSAQATADAVEAGRQALDRHDWQEAYERLTEADRAGPLTAEGLELLAQAAWWSGHGNESTDAWERAYAAHIAAEERSEAAMAAIRVGSDYIGRQSMSLAGGWFARAARILQDEPEGPAHGWLAYFDAMRTIGEGDLEGAMKTLRNVAQIGARFRDRDLDALAEQDMGCILALTGHPEEGGRLMDSAMTAALAGDLTPDTTGFVYCGMIAACSRLADYRRAGEWTEAALKWCERFSITGFPGICRVHKAEVLRIRGDWPDAEAEARRACDELPAYNLLLGVGFAMLEIGEIRLRLGDYRGAEDAFTRASELGRDPQPGLSLLRLAQGEVDRAAAGIRRALDGDPQEPPHHMRLLAAQVEVALAGGDVETARRAADDLSDLAKGWDKPALQAMDAAAQGAVQLAGGDPQSALRNLRRAWQKWQEVEAPYEAAIARMRLGQAYRAQDDEEGAHLEIRAALLTFERLGATPASAEARALLGEEAGPPADDVASRRVTRTFMFTDIEKSTDLVSLIGDEAWESLLTWHDATLRRLFAENGGQDVHHTGDGFVVAFTRPGPAIECAVAIQRALAAHRRQAGFAPKVRIGLHTTEATRRGADYGGRGVHEAARVAAQANGEEILASEDTLRDLPVRFPRSQPREVRLKGIAQPVRVVGIDWR
jgi:class 3 adenylate cyclase